MRFGLISVALAGAVALVAAGGSIAGSSPDNDGDGVFNLVDNCVNEANPSTAGPTEPQNDFDLDGFGQQCDADYDNTGGTVNVTDFNFFIGCFNASQAIPGNPVVGSSGGIDCNAMDHDSTGTINVTDFNFFIAAFNNGSNFESGLPCAIEGDAQSPNMTGRNPCTYDPTPND